MFDWWCILFNTYHSDLSVSGPGVFILRWRRRLRAGWYVLEIRPEHGSGQAYLTCGPPATHPEAVLDVSASQMTKRLVWMAAQSETPLTLAGTVTGLRSVQLRRVTAHFARSRLRRRLQWAVERGLAGVDAVSRAEQCGYPQGAVPARGWLSFYDATYPVHRSNKGYAQWLLERAQVQPALLKVPVGPVFDVVMPVYNTAPAILLAAITSVRQQQWGRWRLCLGDDGSSDPETISTLANLDHDDRISVGRTPLRGGIAAATVEAAGLGSSPWLVFLDHDDELTPDALSCIAEHARRDDVDLIYTDEDKIQAGGDRHDPHFKPGPDPDLLLGYNYIGHCVAMRRTLYEQISGVHIGFEGAQDHDLLLRAFEVTPLSRIRHVGDICYHWRRSAGSTATDPLAKPQAQQACLKAVGEHLRRVGAPAHAEPGPAPLTVRVRWQVPDPPPLVSVLIPTKDGQVLERCLTSLLTLTDYPALEVLVVDNRSTLPGTAAVLAKAQEDPRVQVLPDARPFNFSALMNMAARKAQGSVLVLLNDDTEILDPSWLRELVSQAVRPSVGCVGCMLLYPNGTIQHAGVTLGIGGVAGHRWRGQPSDYHGHFGRLLVAHTVSAVTGACLAIRTTLWQHLGGMDEVNLPIAFNDIDLCLRAAALGHRTVWTPEVVLLHHESLSRGPEDTPAKRSRFANETLYMRKQWGQLLDADPYWSVNFALDSEQGDLRRR